VIFRRRQSAFLLFFLLVPLGSQVVLRSARADLPFDWEALQKLILKNPNTGRPIQDAEELVSILPEELRSNFTFIQKSRSPHGLPSRDGQPPPVDGLNPRILLFSDDGKLVIAVTSNPNDPSYHAVEAIQYDDSSSSFQMKFSRLPPEPHPEHENPEKNCTGCHGQDPRPIFDSYPTWPGTYGESHDAVVKGSAEYENYRNFLKARKGNGPFKYLKWPEGSENSPYMSEDPFKSIGKFDLKLAPNTRLGAAFTELNRKRLLRKLKGSKKYKRYRSTIAGLLLGCEKFPKFEERIALIEKQTEKEEAVKASHCVEPKCMDGIFDKGLERSEQLATMDYISQLLEIGRADWSLAKEPNSNAFYDGNNFETKYLTSRNLLLPVLQDIADEDIKFRKRFEFLKRPVEANGYPFGMVENIDAKKNEEMCKYFKKNKRGRSLPACFPEVAPILPESTVERVDPNPILRAYDAQYNQAVSRCVNCHESQNGIAPYLPFSNVEKMKALFAHRPTLTKELEIRLNGGNEKFEKMPPDGESLKPAEKEIIFSYFK
jgi:hypothetical protein